MTFRSWLRKIPPNSRHAPLARMALADLEFNPSSYYDLMLHLAERQSCDHNFLAADAAWTSFTREHYPAAHRHDVAMHELLDEALMKLRLRCTYSGVKARAGVSALRGDAGCRERGASAAVSWVRAHYG
jgi:hypothetical protein